MSEDGSEGENSNKDTSMCEPSPPLPLSSITEALLENREKGKAVTCLVNDGEAAMMQF